MFVLFCSQDKKSCTNLHQDRPCCAEWWNVYSPGIYPPLNLRVLCLPLILQDLLPHLCLWSLPRPHCSSSHPGSSWSSPSGRNNDINKHSTQLCQVVEVCPEEVDEYALYSRYSVPEPKKQSKVRTRSVSICREAVTEEEEEKK